MAGRAFLLDTGHGESISFSLTFVTILRFPLPKRAFFIFRRVYVYVVS